MCLAVYHEGDCPMTEREFNTAWSNNPDGGGFCFFLPDGSIATSKFMVRDQMRAAYFDAVEKYGGSSPFAVHFRIATHGTVSIDNCHPFQVNKNTVIIHNGIIPVIMDGDKNRSDTRIFAENYLSKMPKGWQDDPHLTDMVEDYIGSSKIVMFTTDKHLRHNVYIFNERMGQWANNSKQWFSNGSHGSYSKLALLGGKQMPLQDFSEYSVTDEGVYQCYMCSKFAVMEDMCYDCGTCQVCFEYGDDCKCDDYESIHRMTDEQIGNI